MLTTKTCKRLCSCGLAAVALALLPASAGAVTRPAMRSCGDLSASNGLLVGDITARRVTCQGARMVARATPGRCGQGSSCRVRGFTCLVGRAAPELRFARCTRPRGGDELHKTIRFDFGS